MLLAEEMGVFFTVCMIFHKYACVCICHADQADECKLKIIFYIPPACHFFVFLITGIRFYHNLYKCVSDESLCMLSFHPILNDAKSTITILVAISC